MEHDHYARYLQLVAQCRDIATEIHANYREIMFPRLDRIQVVLMK